MAQTSNQRQVNFRAIFRKYDKDTDGFISVKDLINVFKELGEEINDEELKEYLRNTGIKNSCENYGNFDILRVPSTLSLNIYSKSWLMWEKRAG